MTIPDNFLRFSLASGITLALLVGVGSAALAREVTVRADRLSQDAVSERVYYGDLNLASAPGEKTLYFRVSGAVRRVCAPQESFDYGSCRRFAWRGARPQMNLAVARAKEIALHGTSSIAPVAILIATPE